MSQYALYAVAKSTFWSQMEINFKVQCVKWGGETKISSIKIFGWSAHVLTHTHPSCQQSDGELTDWDDWEYFKSIEQ